MRDNLQKIEEFCNLLKNHAVKKSELYDGVQEARVSNPDTCLRFAVEELGEVSSAITRGRMQLAKYETIDLAHCAMLIWLSLQ